MDDFYKQNILDHYRTPRNAGVLDNPTHSHEENNPLCGDVVRIDLRVNDADVVEAVTFKGKGCAISQASASMLTERVQGMSLAEVKQISKDDILDELGIELGPTRLKCALLSLKVLKAGVYGINQENLDDDSW